MNKIPNYDEWLFRTERGNSWLYFAEDTHSISFDDNPPFFELTDIEDSICPNY